MKHISVAQPVFHGKEKEYVLECMDSTRISSAGKFIDLFEQQFAAFCETDFALTCNNGTAALHLALMAHDVGPGDEVIVPSLTYIATANAVAYCGGTPVFADSEKDTGNIDPNKLEQLITSRTKGIIVVHLYGHPVDMDPIMAIARKHNLFVVEDVAEALGALYKGQKVGSIGSIGTFSFFGNKIITAGEGGAVVTSDLKLAAKMKLLRGQGMDPNRRYWFPVVGYNYRMPNITAAIALAQLEQIEWHQNKRFEVARAYNKLLAEADGMIVTPLEKPWAQHAYWMYSVLLKNDSESDRDQLMTLLAADGIETRPVFYPLHIMPPYKQPNHVGLPQAESWGRRGISLPTHAALTHSDIKFVSERFIHHLRSLQPTFVYSLVSEQPTLSFAR